MLVVSWMIELIVFRYKQVPGILISYYVFDIVSAKQKKTSVDVNAKIVVVRPSVHRLMLLNFRGIMQIFLGFCPNHQKYTETRERD